MRVQSTRNASSWKKNRRSLRVGQWRSSFIIRCWWRCSCRRTCSSFGPRIFTTYCQQIHLLFCWSRWRFGRLCIGGQQSLHLAFAWERRQRHFGQRIAPHLAWAHRFSPRRPVRPLQWCPGLCRRREDYQAVDDYSEAVMHHNQFIYSLFWFSCFIEFDCSPHSFFIFNTTNWCSIVE